MYSGYHLLQPLWSHKGGWKRGEKEQRVTGDGSHTSSLEKHSRKIVTEVCQMHMAFVPWQSQKVLNLKKNHKLNHFLKEVFLARNCLKLFMVALAVQAMDTATSMDNLLEKETLGSAKPNCNYAQCQEPSRSENDLEPELSSPRHRAWKNLFACLLVD